jgi:outer membrane lipoprotein-sorting protein
MKLFLPARLIALLSATAALLCPMAFAQAKPITPETILNAEHNLTYQGLLLIDGTQQVRVTHGGAGRQRQEFLSQDGHLKALVISDGHIRWQYSPERHMAQVQPMDALGMLPRRLVLLLHNYRFQPMGESKRAGRPVMLVRFIPLHQGNLMHLLWVDHQTDLPLAVERREQDGHLVDRSEYLSIQYNPSIDAQSFVFQIPEGAQVSSTFTMLAHGGSQTPLPPNLHFKAPRMLPPGYALLTWKYFKSSKDVPTLDWHFHDGLNPLSLFAVPDAEKAPLPPDARRVNVGGKLGFFLAHDASEMLTWSAAGASYTLVGHLPEAEMIQMARSTF